MSTKKARRERLKTEIASELWPELEAEVGEMLGRPFREAMDRQVITPDVNDCADSSDGDPKAKTELKESIKRSIRGYYEAGKALSPSRSHGSTDSTPLKPRKTYRKPFERRLYLLDFVGDKGRNPKTKRIAWKRMVTEWNKANPSDIMSLPVLKVEYYRARRDAPLVQQYLVSKAVTIVESYLQDYQRGGWVTDMDGYYKHYQEFVIWGLGLFKDARPQDKFVIESFERFRDAALVIYDISQRRLREDLEREKRKADDAENKEAQVNERSFNQED